jgi:hypothetical protein
VGGAPVRVRDLVDHDGVSQERTLEDLTLIPGTTSLWAAGSTGTDVTVWGHGPGT